MPRPRRVALVTGGTRGIGYFVGKEIVRRIPSAICYMTSRDTVSGYSAILGMELGSAARDRAKFVQMNVRDEQAVAEIREKLVKSHGGLDILVNNAGIYMKPDKEPSKFKEQVKEILATNYWGTKNVISAYWHDLRPHSRIVNITSNLAHVMSKVEPEEMKLKENARDLFLKVDNLYELDGLVMKFQRDAIFGSWKEEGWPTCAYSISKMAINAYTRILQTEFDKDTERMDVVVNAVYPATHHSKIDQSNIGLMEDEEGAKFVFYMATVMPNSHGVFPRGAVIWNNTKVVDSAENIADFRFSNKHISMV